MAIVHLYILPSMSPNQLRALANPTHPIGDHIPVPRKPIPNAFGTFRRVRGPERVRGLSDSRTDKKQLRKIYLPAPNSLPRPSNLANAPQNPTSNRKIKKPPAVPGL